MQFRGNAKIIAQTGEYNAGFVLSAEGSSAQIEDLAADALSGSTSLTFASTPDVEPGDLLFIFNPADGSWSGHRSYYNAGEFVEVQSISGTTLTLRAGLYDSYVAADVVVHKVAPVQVKLEAPHVEITGNAVGAIKVDFGRGTEISNPKITQENIKSLEIARSYDTRITGGQVVNSGANLNLDYGLTLSGCQNTRVLGGRYHARRHAISTGGSGQPGSVPCRDIIIDGTTLSNDRSSNTFAADIHGNAEFVSYRNCMIHNGATLQGANCSLINNTILSAQNNGVAIYAAETLGGDQIIRGNTIITHADPNGSGGRGVIDFGSNDTTTLNAHTNRPVNIIVDRNSFHSEALSGATHLLRIRNRGSDQKINLNIRENDLSGLNDFYAIVSIDKPQTAGTTDSDYMICEGNISPLRGRRSINAGTGYVDLPVFRCQVDSWRQEVTPPTSGSFVNAPAHAFKWVPPRAPDVAVSRATQAYAGSRMGIANVPAIAKFSATLSLATDDASSFQQDTTVVLMAEAYLREV